MEASLRLYKNSLVYVCEEGGYFTAPVEVINFKKPYENLGILPFADDNQENMTILKIIEYNLDKYNDRVNDGKIHFDGTSVMLTISLLIRQCIGLYRPLRVLEIGCGEGELTYFLTKTAAMLHIDSKVFCLPENSYDKPFKINELGLGTEAVNAAVLDMDIDMLKDDCFDFIVINGTGASKNLINIIESAVRLTRKDGRILCLTDKGSLLNMCFDYCVDNYEDFPVNDKSTVLVKIIDENDKSRLKESKGLYKEMEILDSEVSKILGDIESADWDTLNITIRKLSRMEDIAIEIFSESQSQDIELKYVLNQAKENLLNYIYADSIEYKKNCMENLHDFALNRGKFRESICRT